MRLRVGPAFSPRIKVALGVIYLLCGGYLAFQGSVTVGGMRWRLWLLAAIFFLLALVHLWRGVQNHRGHTGETTNRND